MSDGQEHTEPTEKPESADASAEAKGLAVKGLSQLSPQERMEVIGEAMGGPGVMIAQSYAFSGPLPPADELRAYNDVVPNAAERIIAMAENEQKHRHTTTVKYLHNDRCRVVGATVVALALVGAAAFTAYLGHPLTAGVLGMASVLTAILRQVLAWLPSRRKDDSDD